ncbi:MAG: glutamine synthetase III [Clostridia bacterium]|nr:glutamine synthetase III [Clostridia bacterium]
MNNNDFVMERDFACNVFHESIIKERLSAQAYSEFRKAIDGGYQLSREVADEIALVMKEWALERGATHYTHWFQPLNGSTAEKHEAFLAAEHGGHAILEFNGKVLIKGESDASSFPSGGLRATFEARGYTAWDPTSPTFLKEDMSGVTLCIPTTFLSYTGETLDEKTPLLRSMQALNEQAVKLLHILGHDDVNKVTPSIGVEQEYFLIDYKKFLERKDLVFAGRTLIGSRPPKGQELEDHYYGALSERISSYMKELDIELWKMGILAKTKHNEVAPAQHELAPVYTTANIASDQNQLIMETMQRVAYRHGLACLLHEKPFSYINGSGKHNNWSIATDTGKNLLAPPKNGGERDNLEFLLFIAAMVRAVDEYAGLLRLSAANTGNDQRLGGFEAPPAIVSMFLGEDITGKLMDIAGELSNQPAHKQSTLTVGVGAIPNVSADDSDRNRTSPFAFTGNKFEFRMLGASAPVSFATTIINTIAAESFELIAERLKGYDDIEAGIREIIKDIYKKHSRVLFNGNGYSQEWVEEARRRGLPEITNMVDASKVVVERKTIAIFKRYNIYQMSELAARFDIMIEKYSKEKIIESRTLVDLVRRQIVPASQKYLREISETLAAVSAINSDAAENLSIQFKVVSTRINALNEAVYTLRQDLKKILGREFTFDNACYYRDVICRDMDEVRKYCDSLERIVSEELWPIPTYAELLFNV